MQTAVVPQGTAGDYSRLAKRRSQPAPIDALFTLARPSATIYTTQDPRYVLSAVYACFERFLPTTLGDFRTFLPTLVNKKRLFATLRYIVNAF